jgi:Mn2+/Fe2+ NRAMP family transporter
MNDRSRPPLTETPSKFRDLVGQPKRGWRSFTFTFWALIGPGVLATLANNDAGGMISYTLTGAHFGIGLFIPLALCLWIATYTTQELAMRLCTVTQTGFTKLIRLHFGEFWQTYNVISLSLSNLLMLTTEFIGMTAGLTVLGLPLLVSVLLSLMLTVSIILFTGYWTKERLALFVGAVNVVFVILAFMTHPRMAAIEHAFTAWDVPSNSSNVLWYVAALIGNSVAPFAIFFQGSADIDKGLIDRHIHLGRLDTLLGSILETGIAACAILAGAALYGRVSNLDSTGPADLIKAFLSSTGRWPGILFGLGIFNAGLLASFTVSLSSSWAAAEAFGWAKSLNDKISEAPKFYAVYICSVIIAALVVLIPKLPLNFMSVMAQIGCGILMAPVLAFLSLLTNNQQLMGKHKNSLFENIRAWTVATVLIGIAFLLIWNVIAA